MFKLGVYRLDQYQDGAPVSLAAALRTHLSRNRISFQLFRTPVPASPKQIALFERAMRLVRLSSGVYRTTYRGRFRELDAFVNSILAKELDPSVSLCIEDWAASDCLTSLEWANSLWAVFPGAKLTASDSTLYVIEAALPDGQAFIIEANGEPLQYIRPPFVIRMNPPEPKALVVNWLLAWYARRRLKTLQSQWTIAPEWLDTEQRDDWQQPPFVFRKIPLIHPDAQAMRRSNSRFDIRKHSIFEAAPHPCHAIRTMNILNLAYLPTDHLLESIDAVWRSLLPGGIWIVGRTIENSGAHHVSIFSNRMADSGCWTGSAPAPKSRRWSLRMVLKCARLEVRLGYAG